MKTLTERAQVAVNRANTLRRNHKKSKNIYRTAVKAVALLLLRENQRAGHHYTKQTVEALR